MRLQGHVYKEENLHKIHLLWWLITFKLVTGRKQTQTGSWNQQHPLWNGTFHFRVGLPLSSPNCFEQTPGDSVIDSLSCGDPLNKLWALFTLPWRWRSHTSGLGSCHPPWELHHSYAHMHTHTRPLTHTTRVSVCQSGLWWLSSTTKLSLHLASAKPPAELRFPQSKWDWIQNSHWARNFWNIIQFREVKFRKGNVFTLFGHVQILECNFNFSPCISFEMLHSRSQTVYPFSAFLSWKKN